MAVIIISSVYQPVKKLFFNTKKPKYGQTAQNEYLKGLTFANWQIIIRVWITQIMIWAEYSNSRE